ncbi:hypothetical protein [Algoriphagus namhaensis]
MRQYFSLLVISFTVFILTIPAISFAQNPIVDDISDESQANYLLANIKGVKFISHPLFEGGLYINSFVIDDSKATPAGFFEETDEILSSILITCQPDGDYYTKSKLYKITGLENPEILSFKEGVFPEIIVEVEHGKALKRKREYFKIVGI